MDVFQILQMTNNYLVSAVIYQPTGRGKMLQQTNL